MNFRIRKIGTLVTMALLFGCGSESVKETEEVPLGGMDFEKEALEKINLALVQKPDWSGNWVEILGQFSGEDFQLVLTDSINPREMPEKNPIHAGDPLYPYQFPHPEGNGTIDIYSYKIEAQESLDAPYLNPDSEVIWYRNDGMKERLLFIGPSGMFEEGMWLNANEFLVLGYFQEEEGFRPMVWLIQVDKHLLHLFKLGKISKTYRPESYLDKKIKKVDLSVNGV
ncbi:bifunctional isocitrate dehydrogenase kinase/phosphatase [Algoriphagus sp. CAU 1675]|uniref:bifunctional isocitrate dehydrogenase kinase/phosphatase n=1 Tax=Algoriphagus sp. CAU 1675 TaxID=3032597 RepID=UPI0023D97A79|nr:bifunctional isocitrate dehydrogenase kinase/phosphatase [Algoriphagus sp. CAU 1675]MDF2158258.1 bifunctional isocitrate dehydrogenase kinase/phosphatase [Algoriphagus sp. CAU 1675]